MPPTSPTHAETLATRSAWLPLRATSCSATSGRSAVGSSQYEAKLVVHSPAAVPVIRATRSRSAADTMATAEVPLVELKVVAFGEISEEPSRAWTCAMTCSASESK